VQRGDLLADCSASELGELALGKNILIAYLPWEGYNFEDAVVISERLVSDDVYTSIHVQKYDVETRETRFGVETITPQIPGVSDRETAHLDGRGIAKIGSWVREGDILVGKVSPKSSQPLSPYERLAYDIANVEAATTEDTSLRVPKGVEGRVVNCQSVEVGGAPLNEQAESPGRVRIYLAEKRRIQVGDKVAGRHGNKGIVSTVLPRQDMPYLPNGAIVDMVLNPLGIPSRMNVGQVFECLLGLAGVQLGQQFKITPFDEIYGAEASRSLVYLKLYQARLRTNQDWLFNLRFPGKTALLDGRTGGLFDQWVTVGYAYMLKLVHLVDEKIHARSTGPYSLVTKQPLGGRSKHGGQRLGEMEVWALEGFGAAYTLQEMLTSKSDDIVGREQVVEAILFKGKMSLGNPEAFKVLVRELQSLCLDVGVYTISPGRLQRTAIDIGRIP
jgi:DNA-directed RNA polymerase subunit beta